MFQGGSRFASASSSASSTSTPSSGSTSSGGSSTSSSSGSSTSSPFYPKTFVPSSGVMNSLVGGGTSGNSLTGSSSTTNQRSWVSSSGDSSSTGGNIQSTLSNSTFAPSSPSKLSSSSFAYQPKNYDPSAKASPNVQASTQTMQQQFSQKRTQYKQQYELHQQHLAHKRNTPVTSSPHYHHHNNPNNSSTAPSYIFTPGDNDFLSGSSKSAYRSIHNFFANDSIRSVLLNRNFLNYIQCLDDLDEETRNQGPISEKLSQIPSFIDQYHSLYPLDRDFFNDFSGQEIYAFGESFRVIDSMTASPCCLRRISEHQLMFEQAYSFVEPWFKVRHPNIVSLKNLITTDQFGTNNDLLFIFDFCAGAETLEEHFFIETSRAPSEAVLWSLLCQVVSALREIHSHNLAYRTFAPNKILILPGTHKRFKLNCVGMRHTLDPTDDDIAKQQQKDFKQLGALIVGLICTLKDLPESQDSLSLLNSHENAAKYSQELIDIITYLLHGEVNINTLISKLAIRYLEELSNTYGYIDSLENELAKELENGRLFRILVKLNFVAQHEDIEYSTKNRQGVADRQMIKLFLDYLFVQVSDSNQCILDFGHIVEALNKLDAGTNEKVLLMSRDEQSLIVVTYKDLKNSIKTQFSNLLRKNKV